jgi:fructosamine-3-kinase
MNLWEEIEQSLTATLGRAVHLKGNSPVGGGSINRAYRLESNQGPFFVKLNSANGVEMFNAEAEGLEELQQAEFLRVPAPLAWGKADKQAYLVLECMELDGSGSAVALGHGLAAMHQVNADSFGWYRDNTIGSTSQRNRHTDNWCEFWQQQRLGYQLDLANRKAGSSGFRNQGEQLLEALPLLLDGHMPEASLLHGDLWSGNYAFTRAGEPAIFDPAVYYGDRETDIAMTELFGGFGREFYAAYRDSWPLDSGYATRKTLYNLYHVINHFNMFGGGYLSQAQGMMADLLSQVR